MAVDYTDLSQPSDQYLLAAAKRALPMAYKALEIGKGDRRLTLQSIDKLRAEIEALEARISAANLPADGGIILAQFE